MTSTAITHGLANFLQRITPVDYVPYTYEFKESREDFRVEEERNEDFIPPILSEVSDYSSSTLKESRIILIEAIGATGKTELTKHISNKLKCPIFDLGKTNVVAGNSLTGLLSKRLNRKDHYTFLDNIAEGRSTLLIDALDEGYMKTNHQGFMDFLDDILSLENIAKCPIIMLGRYNAIELAAAYLYDKDIKFVTLQIEPFTLQQAREFIDTTVKNKAKLRYATIYRDTRDYLLDTIGGFFKDQASIRNKMSERFIGYAPVLLSIAAFFDENVNYQIVLEELKEAKTKSVSLIVDILSRILERDRLEKVFPNLVNGLIAYRDPEFQKQVYDNIYTREEQCARILYTIMGYPFPELSIKDTAFLTAYDEQIQTWILEHPFMGKQSFGNIVFESYALAVLVTDDKYKTVAMEYMRKKGVSYMFAYIYKEIHGFERLEKQVLPYIYSSLLELNTKTSFYSLNISRSMFSDEQGILCDFEFVGSDEGLETYSGTVLYSQDDVINLGAKLEGLNVDVPLTVAVTTKKIDINSPTYIKCAKFLIGAEELILHKKEAESNIMIECDSIDVLQTYEQYVQVINMSDDSAIMRLVSSQRPDYPFYEYWTDKSEKMSVLSPENVHKYVKLRSIVLQFRSHSKNELAKHKDKINFVLGGNELGKKVIHALIVHGVIFESGHLYKINSSVMDTVLGISYDGVRNFEVTPQIINFLDLIN